MELTAALPGRAFRPAPAGWRTVGRLPYFSFTVQMAVT